MLALVLAQMGDGDNHMNVGWWWVMGIGWLVFLALVVVLVFTLVRHVTRTSGPGSSARRDAEDILAERFAHGDIDEDEYRRRRDALRGEFRETPSG